MKKICIAVSLFFLITGFAAIAHADLDGFLRRVNEKAIADLSRYSVDLSVQFGVPVPQVDAIIKRVASPSDAFMCLQLSQMSKKQPETVVQTYTANRDKGWGVIAKELGIKPGSPEFHALKRGDFAFRGDSGPSGSGGDRGHENHGPGKGKGKGKHNK